MIPKIFHRIWLDEPIPERYEKFWLGFKTRHPTWEFRTWNSSDELDWLQNRDLFDSVKTWAGRADVARYEIVHRYGGVYVDTDVECLNPIEELLSDDRLFIAWEDDNLLCPTVFGASPEHPALRHLIDALPNWVASHPNDPPNYQTGPVPATEAWRMRDDVRRLPPIYFYPVGWWEREKLGGPYPAKTLLVHHWDKGWESGVGPDSLNQPFSQSGENTLSNENEVVVLVPWRGGDPDREAAWEYVRPHLEKLNYPIFEGDRVGPWNRSAAVNAAARSAGDWDVAVVADSDTVDDLSAITRAVKLAAQTGGAVVPWNRRVKLDSTGIDWLKCGRGGRTPIDRTDRTSPTLSVDMRGGTIVVSRRAWDVIGGFDEGFTEWGFEDVAFRTAVRTLTRLDEIPSTCFHLWHPHARKHSSRGHSRMQTYKAAAGKPDKMRWVVPAAKLPSVAVLIPFRDDGQRAKAAAYVMSRWHELLPDAHIVVGSDEGEPFSKTTAVNDAFRRSSGEILVVTDADAWIEQDALENGIKMAAATGRLVVPWTKVYRLRKSISDFLLDGQVVKPEAFYQVDAPSPNPQTAGTIYVIRRDAFELVNGMDSRFRGWGYEDVCFRRACDVLLGKTVYAAGDAFALWHPRPKNPGRVWGDSDTGQLNSELNGRYVRAERKPGAMRALVNEDPLSS